MTRRQGKQGGQGVEIAPRVSVSWYPLYWCVGVSSYFHCTGKRSLVFSMN
ncbi:MAG: hypothetical protein NHB32_00885 [Fischerella sp. CENA71]|nr:hypothetical protein [Fischerella sp. CENA71]